MTNVELTSIFLNEISEIEDGYEVVECEQDGHDKYGSLRWAFCKNGYSCRSYMIKSEKKNAVSDYIKSVSDYGLSIDGGMPYYVDPKIMLEDVMSEDFQLVQITDEEKEGYFKEKEEIIKIVEAYKIHEKNNIFISDWNRYSGNTQYMHGVLKKKKYEKRMNDLDNVVLTNKDMFIKTAKKYVDNSDDLLGRLN